MVPRPGYALPSFDLAALVRCAFDVLWAFVLAARAFSFLSCRSAVRPFVLVILFVFALEPWARSICSLWCGVALMLVLVARAFPGAASTLVESFVFLMGWNFATHLFALRQRVLSCFSSKNPSKVLSFSWDGILQHTYLVYGGVS